MSRLTNVSEEDLMSLKKQALSLCSSHLKGSWTNIKEDDIDIHGIEGGFISRLYLLRNKCSPSESVCLRLYGGKIVDNTDFLKSIGPEGELLVVHHMDINGIGPKLLGVFDGGRLEEYVDGRHLSFDDMKNEAITGCLARKLARLHSLSLPFNRKPKDFIGIIREAFDSHWKQYHQDMKQEPLPLGGHEDQLSLVQSTLEYDFYSLLSWFQETMSAIKTRVVLCHEDVNRSNILVKDSATSDDDRVTLLDFEFAGYSYRGTDVGNHFKHRYRQVGKFKERRDGKKLVIPYPDEDERRIFVRHYLEEAKKVYPSFNPSIDNEENLLIEADLHDGLHQLFFVAYMISFPGMFQKLGFNPGVFLGGLITDFEARKQRVEDMRNRFHK